MKELTGSYSWDERKFRALSDKSEEGPTISVLSFNVLCDASAQAKYYPSADPAHLEPEFRQKNILKELLRHSCDVLCVQELCGYESFFKPQLESKGYHAVFKKRPDTKEDGCAIFWKREKLTLDKTLELEFDKLATSVSNERYRTQNVALMALFSLAPSNGKTLPPSKKKSLKPKQFAVATTQIYWKQESFDIQFNQTQMFIEAVDDFKGGEEVPALLAGDFNSVPFSFVYNRLATSHSIHCSLTLKSAYAAYSEKGHPPFTLLGKPALQTVDYIWISDHFDLCKLLEVPTEEDLRKMGEIPGKEWSSNHASIAVVVKFNNKVFTPRKKEVPVAEVREETTIIMREKKTRKKLRKPPPLPLVPVKEKAAVVCRFWLQGKCKYGEGCHFAHPLPEPGYTYPVAVPFLFDPRMNPHAADFTVAESESKSEDSDRDASV